MPDYNSILRRSIEGVPDHTVDMRRAIYERARATIARQLAAVDPPIPAEQIELQHQKLEQAIGEIEAEYAFAEFDPAEFGAEIGLHDAPDAPDAEFDESDDYDEDEEEDLNDGPAYDHAEASIDFGTPSSGYVPSGSSVDIRPSRAPMMIVLGLLLLAGIGATVLGYRHQDQVMAFVDKWTAPADEGPDLQGPVSVSKLKLDEDSQPPAVASGEGETVTAKSEERLGTGSTGGGVDELRGSEPGETIQPQTNDDAAGQSVAALESQPQSVEIVPDDGSSSGLPTGSEAAEPVVTGAAGPTDNVAGSDRVGIVSQRAIYYTQGVGDNPGQVSQGSVNWSRVERPDGLPAIQASIKLADPKVDVIITISKNTDEGLPASHLIEVSFDGVANVSAAAIDRIPALVMKPSEQARGQPLVGAGVPVTESIFWIALSDEAEKVASNLTTLRDGTWFDMPLLFKDQQRALITFEKGGPGEALFKEVLSAWEAS